MKKQIVALVTASLVGVVAASAASFITDVETFPTLGNAPATWHQEDILGGPGSGNADVFNVSLPGFSGGPTDYSLHAGYDATLDPPPVTDRIFTDAGPFGGGVNYNTAAAQPITFVGFDFYGSEGLGAGGLQLYFTSTAINNAWQYTFGPTTADTWQSFQAPLTDGSWTFFGTGTPDFATALTDINEIGFHLTYVTGLPGGQDYFFDNFRRGYNVPEPGTYAALGFALSSLGFTFRRRLNSVTDRIKAMFKAA